MESRYRVGIVGFSAFERATLDAFFRLTARRAVRYEMEPEARLADLLLVDGDVPALITDPRVVPARSVFVGRDSPPGALLHLPRPLNMMVLLRQLDQKLSVGAAPAAAAALSQPSPPAAARAAQASPAPAPAPAPGLALRPALPPEPDTGPDTVPGAGSSMDDILVVDDSDIALRFMAEVLGRYGFDVHLARSGEEALRRVSEQHFEFVFMDVNMPGMNGHQTTKLIKNARYEANRRPPTVVMLTSKDAMADRLRGTLAGCDAYLTKPLQREPLLKIIGDRIVEESAQQTTQNASLR